MLHLRPRQQPSLGQGRDGVRTTPAVLRREVVRAPRRVRRAQFWCGLCRAWILLALLTSTMYVCF